MRRLLVSFLERRAERKFRAQCKTNIGPGAVVQFRGLGSAPPSVFTLGDGTIFRARVSADRREAAVIVGSNTFIGGSHFVCAERIEIGNDVLIAWGCTIVDHNSHSIFWSERKSDVADTHNQTKNWTNVAISPVIIKDKAWIGFNSIILKGVVIGEGAIVGAGSVVSKNVEPYTIVAGNPAIMIKRCSE